MKSSLYFRSSAKVATLALPFLSACGVLGTDITLQQEWVISNEFDVVSYTWEADGRDFYSSDIGISVQDNTITLYHANMDPFGSKARCGGGGCLFSNGALISTLKLKRISANEYEVLTASGQGSFLERAQCKLKESPTSDILQCTTERSPHPKYNPSTPSIFTFLPHP